MSAPRYDRLGTTYTATRREDPEIAGQIHAALGDGRTLLNVGAGAGAYEPRDRAVLAVEPSPVMIAQRPADAAPAVVAAAERLPFVDGSFDAAMALHTVHHWSDPAAGLAELRRVAGRVVVVAGDAGVIDRLWLTAEYFPGLAFGARRTARGAAAGDRRSTRPPHGDPVPAGPGRLRGRLHRSLPGSAGGVSRPGGAAEHVHLPAPSPRPGGRGSGPPAPRSRRGRLGRPPRRAAPSVPPRHGA
jgi:SAM-dependent methyltransferase